MCSGIHERSAHLLYIPDGLPELPVAVLPPVSDGNLARMFGRSTGFLYAVLNDRPGVLEGLVRLRSKSSTEWRRRAES